MTTPADTPSYPIQRTCPFSEPAEYQRLRDEQPIARALLPSGRHAWLVSRHADVRAVLRDPRMSSDRRNPGFPLAFGRSGGGPVLDRPISMIGLDGAEHAEARRAVVGEFTVRRADQLRPRIQQIVDDQIDAMLAAGPPTDLVQLLALPVPSLVICQLLGVPYRDHEFFQERSAKLLRRTVDDDDRAASIIELDSYVDELVAGKENDPGDDLLGRQIAKRKAEGNYRRDEMVSLAFLLLIAGHETTANMISLGILALLEDPEAAAALRADPSQTLPAIEEMLRYFTIVDSVTSRVATEEVDIGGQQIGAGEGVVALGLSANHDPETFDQPNRLDLDRGARHHVAFGFGPHQCLGQNLARAELQIVLDTVLRRLPGLRLATEVDSLPFKEDAAIYGIYQMPVAW